MVAEQFRVVVAVAGLLAMPLPLSAQTFPSRAVHIVTSEPGGGNDFAARVIAQGLTGPLGQPVVVDNRGGASGAIAGETVAKGADRKSTRLNSSHSQQSRMPSSA